MYPWAGPSLTSGEPRPIIQPGNPNEAAITESCRMSPETQDVSSEWKEEIARRCREIDEGTVELTPGEDVLKEAAKELHG